MAKYEGTQAISRAFELLKMFDDEHPEWALADLVEASAFKKTTAFRMLSALEHEGVLQRSESGDYQLGSELSCWVGGRCAPIASAALPNRTSSSLPAAPLNQPQLTLSG